MQILSLLIYNLSVRLYGVGISIASLFNDKALLWITGRKNQEHIQLPESAAGGKRIWVHCASLGEFEQARPVIEKIKTDKPSAFIILTFFSPSGFEIRKNYKYADTVLYLPLDTAENTIAFIDKIKPDLALFVKYEFWYHYLAELKIRKIPTVLFSGIFRKEQVFFAWYGGFFKNMLNCFDKIFVQNKESQELLKKISVSSEVSFDTRFDRVHQIAQSSKSFAAIEVFKGANRVLIAGSTWKEDERLITALINRQVLNGYKYIIAPHNLSEQIINELQQSVKVDSVRLSQLTDSNAASANVIIADTMGDLASIYRYSDIAYVGGGFNASVHNVLEPAVYGIPVLFGPNYSKSAEAKELVAQRAAFSITNAEQLQNRVVILTNDSELMTRTSLTAKQYVQCHLGGVNDIYNYIKRYL